MQRQGIGGSAVNRIRAAGSVLLVAHLLFVAWLTLRPLDVPWVMPTNPHPLAGIQADLRLGWPEAARRIGEDLALLAPLGVLLPLAHGRRVVAPLASLVRTVTAGALLSLAIALLQTGVPGRVVDIDTVLMNTAGGLTGGDRIAWERHVTPVSLSGRRQVYGFQQKIMGAL